MTAPFGDRPASSARLLLGVPLPVLAVAAAVAATLLGDSMLYAVMPSSPQAWGLSIPAVGILLAANRLVRLATNPLAALAFDRLGRRLPFTAAIGLAVAVTLTYAWATSFAVLLAARLVWGTAWSILRLGGFWTVLEEATDANRGLLMGWYSSVVRLGSVAGALVGAVLADLLGHRLTLTLFAATTMLAGLTWIMASRGRGGEEQSIRPIEEQRRPLWETLSEPRLLAAGSGALLMGLVFSGLLTASLGFYLHERFGAEIAVLGVAVGVTSTTGVLLGLQWGLGLPLSPVVGHLADRWGRVRVTAGGFIAGAAGLVALAGFASPLAAMAGVVVAFVGAIVLNVGLATSAGDLAPPERRSAVMSSYATFLDVGSATGPLVGLSFASLAVLRGMYLAAAGLLLLAALGYVYAFGRGRLSPAEDGTA